MTLQRGKAMARQLFSYSMDGSRWCVVVDAEDETEARRRLHLAAMGSYDGVVGAEIPGWMPIWVVRATVWLLNFLRVGPKP
jgi:hypothetical protein